MNLVIFKQWTKLAVTLFNYLIYHTVLSKYRVDNCWKLHFIFNQTNSTHCINRQCYIVECTQFASRVKALGNACHLNISDSRLTFTLGITVSYRILWNKLSPNFRAAIILVYALTLLWVRQTSQHNKRVRSCAVPQCNCIQ